MPTESLRGKPTCRRQVSLWDQRIPTLGVRRGGKGSSERWTREALIFLLGKKTLFNTSLTALARGCKR